MAPSYHLLPNFRTVPPPNGPLALGTLLTDLQTYEPINQELRVEIPENRIQEFHIEGFTATRARMLKGDLGIWAKFVAIEGIGGGINWSAEGNEELEFNFQGLDTVEFYPTREYMADSMQLAEVKDYFDYRRSKPPVFLVTGLMIARDPSVSSKTQKDWKATAEMGINPPDIVEVGPRAHFESQTNQSISVTKSDDFVVGVRLRKLWYERTVVEAVLGREGRLVNEPQIKGALLGVDEVTNELEDLEDEEVTEGGEGTIKVVETNCGKEITWILPVSD
ncbi:hypothetical protein TWF730_002058 [Orbilia blumenaviensis]|uniref:Uncharacterized protein n=1 Tax=Orbilia blumenaviensis TaxID=1796055 RepID=A0AAV9UCU6_9PEZI